MITFECIEKFIYIKKKPAELLIIIIILFFDLGRHIFIFLDFFKLRFIQFSGMNQA